MYSAPGYKIHYKFPSNIFLSLWQSTTECAPLQYSLLDGDCYFKIQNMIQKSVYIAVLFAILY